MVLEIQKIAPVTAQPQSSWLQEFGKLDLTRFTLDTENCVGRLYPINAATAKAIAEAIGFTARFDHANVRTALFEAWQEESSIAFAMAKNTKPTDVGMRYMADRWQLLETPRGPKGSSLDLTYQAKHLPSSTWNATCLELSIPSNTPTHAYIRIDFKNQRLVLITAKENEPLLPAKATHTFYLDIEGSPILKPNNRQDSEVATLEMNSNQTITPSQSKVQSNESINVTLLNEPTAKYATYSRSEVDSLLKKQAENIASNLNAKIANQQKAMQADAKAQEQKIAKMIDDFQIYCDGARKRIEDAEGKRGSNIQMSLDAASKRLASEVEQFKTYLNKQVMPNLRSLEDRVLTLVNTNILSKKEDKSEKDQATTMIALLALLLSIINLGLTFLKH